MRELLIYIVYPGVESRTMAYRCPDDGNRFDVFADLTFGRCIYVPEPPIFMMEAAGLAAIAGMVWWRRRRAKNGSG